MVITTAMWHFARGVAYAETGKPALAVKERGLLLEKWKAIPADTPWGNSTAHGVLKVAADLLAGDALLAAGDHKAAIEYLRSAVAAEDAVNYNEPPDWDLPAREWLGRALLTDGQYAEAEKVYRDELVKHPKNGRAIFGLVEALRKQGKDADAGRYQAVFQQVWKKADTPLAVVDLYFPK